MRKNLSWGRNDPKTDNFVLLRRPSANSAIFITLIVKAPIIPIITMIIGIFMLCLEYPVPLLKSFAIHRSIILRIVVMFFLSFLSVLFYQVSSCHFSQVGWH